MRRAVLPAAAAVALAGATVAFGQSASVDLAPPPAAAASAAKAAPASAAQPPVAAAPGSPASVATSGTVLLLRGLDKITGRPTNITAPIGKPVQFATLTITARYCYSTPPSETPETTAFVQIEDHRPDQPTRRIFSGWMYASSPGLNGVEHPLYDVWAITCRGGAAPQMAMTSTAPVKVVAPDSSDKDTVADLPAEAGR